MREFLYVDDMAAASLHVMGLPRAVYEENTLPMLSHINVGYGKDLPVSELARLVGVVVGYVGKIEFDTTRPDGTPRKLLDSTRLRSLGWTPHTSLQIGLEQAYKDFVENHA